MAAHMVSTYALTKETKYQTVDRDDKMVSIRRLLPSPGMAFIASLFSSRMPIDYPFKSRASGYNRAFRKLEESNFSC